MKSHPLSEIFPLMAEAELKDLAADIGEHGLREPVISYEGMVLDGRNRMRACELAGVEPDVREYRGRDPLAYVISKNLKRRHLTESQRGMVAARLANLKPGRPAGGKTGNVAGFSETAEKQGESVSQAEAAAALGVSERTVRDARTVIADGTPEEVAEVEAGTEPVSKTAKKVRQRKPKPKPTLKRDPLKDELGADVPSRLRDLFGDRWLTEAAEKLEGFMAELKKVAGAVQRKGTRYKFLLCAEILKALDSARTDLEIAASHLAEGKPHAVCPKCAGDGCKLCREAGWVPRWRLKELKSSGSL